MSIEAQVARALELDDDYPDELCPGCLNPTHDEAVYVDAGRWCPWSRDYLNARRFRREYIAEHRLPTKVIHVPGRLTEAEALRVVAAHRDRLDV